MNTITVSIPDKIQPDHWDIVKLLAAKLYEAGKLTLAAAEMAVFPNVVFAGITGENSVPLINYRISDIRPDAGKI